ncbi:hypothetical protein [Fodinicola acaciae]|uniref:hypothetical protein n=1 Tax=Fodinicola acaciae TaxID=2681555 RepID=UPI0013D79963|nr:hypothetical protein [Fodinicola acaciae]
MSDGDWSFPADLVALRVAFIKAEADTAAVAAEGPASADVLAGQAVDDSAYAVRLHAAWERWRVIAERLLDHPYWAGVPKDRRVDAREALQRLARHGESR